MTPSQSQSVPEAAFAMAIASLPGAGPVSLRAALDGRTPQEAWMAVGDGRITRPPLRTPPAAGRNEQLVLAASGTTRSGAASLSWREFAARCDPSRSWGEAVDRGIGVTWLGEDRYPVRLADDAEAPPILFWRGDLDCVALPTVAVVGTRHCTPAGRAVARELGQELADAGICVVSGMALGIDGAAHRGALASRRHAGVTAGIAASGVDVPYPRQHCDLWGQVVTRGVVLAETVPGRPAQAWRFPARNRIIAALADLVVVVESFEAGGSMLTVDAALARGVDVRAVPGPVHSPSSAGTNRLLLDGAAPVRHAGDVLDALGIGRSGVGVSPTPTSPGNIRSGAIDARHSSDRGSAVLGAPAQPPGSGLPEQRVLDAVGWAPTVLGRIVERSGCPVGAAVGALMALEGAGLVIAGDSWWVRAPQR